MRHTLVVIGWLGVRTAYLDVSKAEALALYAQENGECQDVPIKEFQFNEKFGVYDAWSEGGQA